MSRWPGVPCGFHVLQPSPLPEHRQELSSGRRCRKGCFKVTSSPAGAVGGTGLGTHSRDATPSPLCTHEGQQRRPASASFSLERGGAASCLLSAAVLQRDGS